MLDEEVPEIDIAEFANRREDGGVVLDVRELDEWQAARIPASFTSPLPSWSSGPMRYLPTHHCSSSVRKAGAATMPASWLRSRGIDATNVDGGTDGWIQAGHPVESSS